MDRINEWLAHAAHLAARLGYVRGCYVCEMGESMVDTATNVSQKWYTAAQRSGRRSVGLDEPMAKPTRSSSALSTQRSARKLASSH